MTKLKLILAVGVNVTFLLSIFVWGYIAEAEKYYEELEESVASDLHSPVISPTQRYIASLDQEEINCLALNIYFEARNQSVRGQRAVARVTLNRVDADNYPDTICEVVWQPRQFSWTHDGLSDTPGGNALENEAWALAQDVAISSLENHYVGLYDPTYGATHYHANYVNPRWANSFAQLTSIGEHVFYK